jgi:hypothetical protein
MSYLQVYDSDNFQELLDHFDEQGKEVVRDKIDQANARRLAMEQDYSGRRAIAKECDRIKAHCPQKTLRVLLNLQTALDSLQFQMEQEAYDTLCNIICDPDKDETLFSCFTELMSICNESGPAVAKRFGPNNPQQQLTDAEKLRRAQDPAYPCWTQCKRCNRVMTTSHYNKKHKHMKVCELNHQTKVACLSGGKYYQNGDAIKMAKQILNPRDFNASSQQIDWGDADQELFVNEEGQVIGQENQ